MICGIRWVSELIGIAGGIDVFADRSRGKLARERIVDAEAVAAAAPDLMLASWCGKPFDMQAVLARPGMATVPAVRERRIAEIPAEIILQPGPACLTDGVDRLAREIEAVALDRDEDPKARR
jgi:iron complex transport system substrate-binding protein